MPAYQVIFNHAKVEAIRAWCRTPVGSRFQLQVAAALRLAKQELAQSPLEWGEPLNLFQGGKIIRLHRICSPINLDYRVDIDNQIVNVLDIEIFPKLGGQPDS